MAELGGMQTPNEAPDSADEGHDGEARIDARVLLFTRDMAEIRQRSFAEALATLSEPCCEDWPITGPLHKP